MRIGFRHSACALLPMSSVSAAWASESGVGFVAQGDIEYGGDDIVTVSFTDGTERILADGKMELLALANMHCERRSESTPVEQARGMLAGATRRAPCAR